jgi:hypothetical protein
MDKTQGFLRPTPFGYEIYLAGHDHPVARVRKVMRYGYNHFDIEDFHGAKLGEVINRWDIGPKIANGDFDNDFRFVITANPEPDDPASLYFVSMIATPSQKVIESFTTDDPYSAVEAAREVQAFPDPEEREAYYAGHEPDDGRGWGYSYE